MNEVDTVGNEREMYRKVILGTCKMALEDCKEEAFKLDLTTVKYETLAKGIQAVDNAMNIWHLDNLEHGISIGINPNYYYHSLFQRILKIIELPLALSLVQDFYEITEMDWKHDYQVMDKLVKGVPLNSAEEKAFTKAKFRTATEVERYQHDVLNRMIHKNISFWWRYHHQIKG